MHESRLGLKKNVNHATLQDIVAAVRCDEAGHWHYPHGFWQKDIQYVFKPAGDTSVRGRPLSVQLVRLLYPCYVAPLRPRQHLRNQCGVTACCNPAHWRPSERAGTQLVSVHLGAAQTAALAQLAEVLGDTPAEVMRKALAAFAAEAGIVPEAPEMQGVPARLQPRSKKKG